MVAFPYPYVAFALFIIRCFTVERRHFLQLSGLGAGSLLLPVWGSARPLLGSLTPIPTADKKALADAGLQAATQAGASYADVRVGRYLNQFITTREDKVQNVVNTESYGVGIRVIAEGTWGFAATNTVTADGVSQAARQAVLIAKANALIQQEPVRCRGSRRTGRCRGRRRLSATRSRCRFRRRWTCSSPSTRRP